MIRALGIDTAGCNGQTCWNIAQAQTVVFGAARASISWGYQDKWFPSNWAGMKQNGIHRFSYHLLYPSQPYQSQCDNFLRVVGDNWDDAFPVIDAELDQGMSRTAITNCLCNCLQYIHDRAPKPLIYSRKQWIDTYTESGSWRNLYDWWLAQYLTNRAIEHPGPPDLPLGVTTWLIHQNADHFKAWPGLTPNSVDLDIDRWNGDSAAVDKYFGSTVSQPEPAPIPLTIEQRVTRLEEKVFGV
jgi:GH25 family lysozyme M1 (1,4-beta-N-acetylmuramidase)